MTKELFLKTMKELIALKDDQKELNDAFKKLDPDFNFINFGRHECLITALLNDAMKDSNDWIGWWLYECNMGRDKKMVNSVTDNGKKVKTEKLEDLYEFLVSNKKSRKDELIKEIQKGKYGTKNRAKLLLKINEL